MLDDESRQGMVPGGVQVHDTSYSLVKNFGLCPEIDKETEDYIVKSKFQDPPNHELKIFIFPCSLPDRTQCKDINQLKGKNVIYSNINKAFDDSNLKNPVSTMPEFDGVQEVDLSLQKTKYYKVRGNEIWDQRLDFLNPKKRKTYADYSLHYSDISTRDKNQVYCDPKVLDIPKQTVCKPYFSLVFKASGEKKIMLRKYPTFFGTTGEIGGTAEILILVFMMIYSWYNQHFLKKFVRKEMLQNSSSEEVKALILGSKIKEQELIKDPNKKLEKAELEEKKKKKCQKQVNKKFEEILDANIEDNESGLGLLKSLNELNILTRIFFKDRHRKLLPALVLHYQSNETRKVLSCVETKIMNNKKKLKPKNVEQSALAKLSLEEAYESLGECGVGNALEKAIDYFMKQELNPYFGKKQGRESLTDKQEEDLKSADLEAGGFTIGSKRKKDLFNNIGSCYDPQEKDNILKKNKTKKSKKKNKKQKSGEDSGRSGVSRVENPLLMHNEEKASVLEFGAKRQKRRKKKQAMGTLQSSGPINNVPDQPNPNRRAKNKYIWSQNTRPQELEIQPLGQQPFVSKSSRLVSKQPPFTQGSSKVLDLSPIKEREGVVKSMKNEEVDKFDDFL